MDIIIAWAKAHATIKFAKRRDIFNGKNTRAHDQCNHLVCEFRVAPDRIWHVEGSSNRPVGSHRCSSSPTCNCSETCRHHSQKQIVLRRTVASQWQGLADGVAWDYTLSSHRSLKTLPQHNHKCALETIICGATWSNARVHKIHPEFANVCQRCGQANGTDYHTFWECTASENIEAEAGKKTQYLAPAAATAYQTVPCLWLRGILPAKFTHIDSQYLPPDELTQVPTSSDNIVWTRPHLTDGVFYGDGS